MKAILFVLLVVAPFAGCNPLAGPCVHTYEDPVLRLTAVDAISGAVVASVTLTDFTVDGRSVDTSQLLTEASYDTELLNDGAILCDVPCGFGTEEGTYAFEVDADEHQQASVSVEARYANFSGGCPSSNSGSTTVSVELVSSTRSTVHANWTRGRAGAGKVYPYSAWSETMGSTADARRAGM